MFVIEVNPFDGFDLVRSKSPRKEKLTFIMTTNLMSLNFNEFEKRKTRYIVHV